MKKLLSAVLLLGLLAIPTTKILGRGTVKEEETKKDQTVNEEQDFTLDIDAHVEENLFTGLNDDDIVFQLDGGGFLVLTGDPDTAKQEFEERNKGSKLEKFTVAEAKQYYKKQLEDIYKKQANE